MAAPSRPPEPASARPARAPAREGRTRVGKAPVAPGSSPSGEATDLPLPHERDQSAGQASSAPDPVMKQAKKDIDSGQVDTDLHNLPGPDAPARDRMVVPQRPQTSGGLADKDVGPGSQPKAATADRPDALKGRR